MNKKPEYTATMKELWGDNVSSKGFTRVPSLLIKFIGRFNIDNTDFVLITALIMYQRNTKPAFPRISTLARIANIDPSEAKERIFRQKDLGNLTIEPTKNQQGYYFDLRPLRNKLAELAPELIGIDTSSKNKYNNIDASNSVHASIPKTDHKHSKTEHINQTLAKHRDNLGL